VGAAGVVVLVGGAFLLTVFVGVPSTHAQSSPSEYDNGDRLAPLPPKDLQPLTDPARIFQRDCATCHGADGHGSEQGPSLEHDGPADIYYWVSTGRMPLHDPGERVARRPPLYPPKVVDALAQYVPRLTGAHGTPLPKLQHGNVIDGLELFGLNCATCHAWSGSGSIVSTGKVPSLIPDSPEQVAAAVRIGPGQMPAFGTAALDNQQLSDVVAWAVQLKHKNDAGGWDLFHRGPTTEGAAALIVGLGLMLLAIGWIGTRTRSHAVD
jgi:ubiquinol-cytochrome c reductase cytochrome c subunit